MRRKGGCFFLFLSTRRFSSSSSSFAIIIIIIICREVVFGRLSGSVAKARGNFETNFFGIRMAIIRGTKSHKERSAVGEECKIKV